MLLFLILESNPIEPIPSVLLIVSKASPVVACCVTLGSQRVPSRGPKGSAIEYYGSDCNMSPIVQFSFIFD